MLLQSKSEEDLLFTMFEEQEEAIQCMKNEILQEEKYCPSSDDEIELLEYFGEIQEEAKVQKKEKSKEEVKEEKKTAIDKEKEALKKEIKEVKKEKEVLPPAEAKEELLT